MFGVKGWKDRHGEALVPEAIRHSAHDNDLWWCNWLNTNRSSCNGQAYQREDV
jgi:hypothetical protein